MKHYMSIEVGATDPLVVEPGEAPRCVREVEWRVDRLWARNIKGTAIGWLCGRLLGSSEIPSYWCDVSTMQRLNHLKCDVTAFPVVDIDGFPSKAIEAFEPVINLHKILGGKRDEKKRAAFQYLREHQPKIAEPGLAIINASLLIRQDIWDALNFGDRFIKRTSFVDLQAEKIIPMRRMKQPAPGPKVDLAAHCRRLQVARARGEAAASLKPGLTAVVRRFLGALGSHKRQLRYQEGANLPEYTFRGFLRPGDPGFAGVALKGFMTEDSSKPPGKVAVIGTTRTGDALVLDLQSQGGAVYWFDHESGEFLPLEDHLGTFLTKCTPVEQ